MDTEQVPNRYKRRYGHLNALVLEYLRAVGISASTLEHLEKELEESHFRLAKIHRGSEAENLRKNNKFWSDFTERYPFYNRVVYRVRCVERDLRPACDGTGQHDTEVWQASKTRALEAQLKGPQEPKMMGDTAPQVTASANSASVSETPWSTRQRVVGEYAAFVCGKRKSVWQVKTHYQTLQEVSSDPWSKFSRKPSGSNLPRSSSDSWRPFGECFDLQYFIDIVRGSETVSVQPSSIVLEEEEEEEPQFRQDTWDSHENLETTSSPQSAGSSAASSHPSEDAATFTRHG
mmetsp:Transcript_39880/g.89445  ORF Transcript_39880/g.89445 Transcript_39880/m.89445 type:complete len:290 (+) Transcript_39880:63-932(+)